MNERITSALLSLSVLFFACQAPDAPTSEVQQVPPAAAEPVPAVIVTVRYQCQPGMGDSFLATSEPLLAEVRKEPHFMSISVLRDQNDPDRIVFHERWADKDYYLGAHGSTPHLGAFMEAAMPLLAGPPEIVLWDRHSELTRP